MNKAETLPKFLKSNYETWGNKRVAIRHKDYGIWQKYTWKDYYDNVKWLGLGLGKLGLKADDKVCIIGDNEP